MKQKQNITIINFIAHQIAFFLIYIYLTLLMTGYTYKNEILVFPVFGIQTTGSALIH